MKLNKLIIAALAMLLHIVAYAETRGIADIRFGADDLV